MAFSVKDPGIGISLEQQQKLFQSFSQADVSTTRKYGGTGLGLAISKSLVELMGGTIRVDSELGKGSIFSFEVNIVLPQGTSHHASELTAQDATSINKFEGVKLLLVEDNQVNKYIAEKMLLELGVEVVHASDGIEALTLVKVDKFDCILMDCQMPNMDGYTATKKIREYEEFKTLPIIALTADAMLEEVKYALSVGMNDHIAKPISLEVMSSTLAKWLNTEVRNDALNRSEIVQLEQKEGTPLDVLDIKLLNNLLTQLEGYDATAIDSVDLLISQCKQKQLLSVLPQLVQIRSYVIDYEFELAYAGVDKIIKRQL